MTEFKLWRGTRAGSLWRFAFDKPVLHDVTLSATGELVVMVGAWLWKDNLSIRWPHRG